MDGWEGDDAWHVGRESQRGRMGEPGWPSPTAWPGWGGYRVASGVTTWQLELPGGAADRPESGTAKKEV